MKTKINSQEIVRALKINKYGEVVGDFIPNTEYIADNNHILNINKLKEELNQKWN